MPDALPARLRREAARRSFPEVPSSKIIAQPLRELVRVAAGRLGLSSLTRHEVGWASVDAVYHALDRRLARDLETGRIEAGTVYAYEDGALESFRATRRLGGLVDAIGGHGLTFRNGDALELAARLESALVDGDLARRKLEHVDQHLESFTARQVAQQYLKLFNRVRAGTR